MGLLRQYNSPKPNCSPSIIIQGNFHLLNIRGKEFTGSLRIRITFIICTEFTGLQKFQVLLR